MPYTNLRSAGSATNALQARLAGYFLLFLMAFCPGCRPDKGRQLDEYLALPVWNKEEQAFELVKNAVASESMAGVKAELAKAAVLFSEIKAELGKLKLADQDLKELNQLQLEICDIYITADQKFDEANGYDLAALEQLPTADEKFGTFLAKAELLGQ